MARTKVIDIFDSKYRIASLTLAQVEELFPSSPEELEKLKNLTPNESKLRAYTVALHGLNNALPKDSSDRWTSEKLMEEFDMITFTKLHEAILEHTGLISARTTGETTDSGENKAAVVM